MDILQNNVRQHAHVPLSAVLLIVCATACFTSVDVSVKHLSQRYPVPLIVWARWGVQALFVLAVVGPRMRGAMLRTQRLPLHLLRAVLLIASSLCFFSALRYLPLADSTALNYTAPIMVTLMAGWFLGERLTRPRWAFVIAGFVGMLLIVRPGNTLLGPAALLALAAAALYAVFQVITRVLAREPLMVLLAYPSLVGTLLLSLGAPFVPSEGAYPSSDLAAFVGIGVVGSVGHLLFIKAFQRASASAIAPFTYIQLVWSTLAGWLVFGTLPDGWTATGIVVIAGSGIVLMGYERWRASGLHAAPAAVD